MGSEVIDDAGVDVKDDGDGSCVICRIRRRGTRSECLVNVGLEGGIDDEDDPEGLDELEPTCGR